MIDPPMGLVAELTHRCPLQCPYCANPVTLHRAAAELDTATWRRVLEEAAALGVLQLHFSGGEPTARKDLAELVRAAADCGLYSNLITSGVLLDERLLNQLARAGLDHVQISIQDIEADSADRIGGLGGGHARKLAAARAVTQAGLALTLNFVVHRQNVAHVSRMLDLAEALGAGRVEIAHVQYHGWAVSNRDALLPSRTETDGATVAVEAARQRLKGKLVVDYVAPDYHASRPKACMGGWGRRFMTVTPSGKALPCHVAESLPDLNFPSVREQSLRAIWHNAPAFTRFRGTSWMPEPCRSCDQREIDWGGCRCQAYALTADASRTDPACEKSSDHALIQAAVAARRSTPPAFIYRRYPGATQTTD
ncbi:pyrroloquinoline quinone biosynthesis protein PqqE [Rhodopila sp.]|uniref:pyrroloquinoline quinone biosynthesis protein PqqE n=1 Tax=Rhodopila sp. TaxID=2480087 RepID=UPI003D0F2935